MKKKINNINYRRFLDEGIISEINLTELKQALNNIKGKNIKQGRAILITLYYTGARPNEILRLKAKDITREKNWIKFKLPASKGGLPRTIPFNDKKPHIKEVYNYATSLPPEMYLFYAYKCNYKRKKILKNGKIKIQLDISNKLYYHVKKWFKNVLPDSISPYFLRHNNFSKLAMAGVDLQDIRMLKGSRSVESVSHYVHMSTKKAKQITKKIK